MLFCFVRMFRTYKELDLGLISQQCDHYQKKVQPSIHCSLYSPQSYKNKAIIITPQN